MNPERLEIEPDNRRWGHRLPVRDKLGHYPPPDGALLRQRLGYGQV
ncbi:hypothetical protein [Microcoleus sp. FACHB-672]|nr:hypothetical protein [Microcoleus sp. FACHB-672]